APGHAGRTAGGRAGAGSRHLRDLDGRQPALAAHRAAGGLLLAAADRRPGAVHLIRAAPGGAEPREPRPAGLADDPSGLAPADDRADRDGRGVPAAPALRRLAFFFALELRQVLDALPGAPLGVVVLHGVDQLAHEARGEVDARDHDARD